MDKETEGVYIAGDVDGDVRIAQTQVNIEHGRNIGIGVLHGTIGTIITGYPAGAAMHVGKGRVYVNGKRVK